MYLCILGFFISSLFTAEMYYKVTRIRAFDKNALKTDIYKNISYEQMCEAYIDALRKHFEAFSLETSIRRTRVAKDIFVSFANSTSFISGIHGARFPVPGEKLYISWYFESSAGRCYQTVSWKEKDVFKRRDHDLFFTKLESMEKTFKFFDSLNYAEIWQGKTDLNPELFSESIHQLFAFSKEPKLNKSYEYYLTNFHKTVLVKRKHLPGLLFFEWFFHEILIIVNEVLFGIAILMYIFLGFAILFFLIIPLTWFMKKRYIRKENERLAAVALEQKRNQEAEQALEEARKAKQQQELSRQQEILSSINYFGNAVLKSLLQERIDNNDWDWLEGFVDKLHNEIEFLDEVKSERDNVLLKKVFEAFLNEEPTQEIYYILREYKDKLKQRRFKEIFITLDGSINRQQHEHIKNLISSLQFDAADEAIKKYRELTSWYRKIDRLIAYGKAHCKKVGSKYISDLEELRKCTDLRRLKREVKKFER